LKLQITNKKTIESQAVPGITYTVRLLNKTKRAERDAPIMDAIVRHQTAATAHYDAMIAAGYAVVNGYWDRPKDLPSPTEEAMAEIRVLRAEVDLIRDEFILPAVIRAGLISIAGFTDDAGNPVIATADTLLECGADADALIDEVYLACESASGLSENERKNSPSPTISAEPVGDATNVSTAAPVAA
jgi:hypothetical protein